MDNTGVKYYSPSDNSFYPDELRQLYESAGTWPADGVVVSLDAWITFTSNPPSGFTRGNVNGQPGWLALPVIPLPTSWTVSAQLLRTRLQSVNLWTQAATALMSNPALMLEVLTLSDGVSNTDPDAIAMLNAIGADPTVILARPIRNE